MSQFIPDHILDRIRGATDIVGLIQESLPLKRAGSAYKGLCPFHREKTPSFHVNPARQIYKCFGCGEGGDVFSWIMKTEGVSFYESAVMLAERAHIEVPRVEGGAVSRTEKDPIYRVNRWAAEWFNRRLTEQEMGKAAREYLEGRGVTPEIVEQFQLGYSPDAWDALLKAARRKDIPVDLLTKSGLVTTNEDRDRVYDRFRNRLMFPIRDVRGRVIGFGARSLDNSEPKYLNSPETPLFAKSAVLYALDRAQSAMREKKQAVVVEGYMDVIAAHQHGVPWTVGVLGTALTHDHVRILRRSVEEAILIFDADEAGQSSANRSLDAFAAEELAARVATLPEGKDPDEFLRAKGTEAFIEVIAQAVDGVTHKLNRALKAAEGASSLAQSKALDDVLATVALMPNAITQSVEVRKISERTRLHEPVLQRRLAALSSRSTFRPNDARTDRPADGGTLAARDAECELLEVLLTRPEAIPLARSRLQLDLLPNADVRALIERLFDLARTTGTVGPAEILARTREDAQRRIVERIIGKDPAEKVEAVRWCEELINGIEARAHREQASVLQCRADATDQAETDIREVLRGKLEALRKAQRKRGALTPKST